MTEDAIDSFQKFIGRPLSLLEIRNLQLDYIIYGICAIDNLGKIMNPLNILIQDES